MTSLHQMQKLGQSPWIDYIDRELVNTDKIKKVLDDGVTGLTSNPTIWQKAFASTSDYDADIHAGLAAGKNTTEIYESIAVSDIQKAADALRGVYDSSNGTDGFVSLEVMPRLSYDANGTIADVRRYWKLVDRPNLMIKIPATTEGITAYVQAIAEGININMTMMFGVGNLYQVADGYFRGLEARVAAGQPIDKISSVASFFVSRVDATIDPKLQALADAETDAAKKQALLDLKGKAGIANAKLAYKAWQSLYASERWMALEKLGAQKQRCLWASTSTKDPAYSDVMYVEGLIGPDTVDTIPPATIEAFIDHGKATNSLTEGVDEAIAQIGEVERLGISLEAVTYKLQVDGLKAFGESFDSMIAALNEKEKSVK